MEVGLTANRIYDPLKFVTLVYVGDFRESMVSAYYVGVCFVSAGFHDIKDKLFYIWSIVDFWHIVYTI